MLYESDIHDFLRGIGIKSDSTVLVHTSMRALGGVDGGCDGLIDAFKSYLTEGLFLVPTHTWANVGRKQPIYDVRSTVPCIGALPTVAAFRRDGVRSLHPTHSVAAFGARAAEFVAGEEKATSPGFPGGAWARLYDEDATILLLGVGLNRNTYIHAIDEMIGDLPHRLTEPIDLTVIDYEGKAHALSYRKHDRAGSEFFGNYEAALRACGAYTDGRLGDATVGIFYTRKGTAVIRHLWEKTDHDLCDAETEIPAAYYADLIERQS